MSHSEYNDSNYQKIFIKIKSYLKSDRTLSRVLNFAINFACEAYTRGIVPRFFDKKSISYSKDSLEISNDFDADISNYTVISFDVFDTLLLRLVEPGFPFFYALEKKYSLAGFAKERVNAENRARNLKGGKEITLKEIYETIIPKFEDALSKELEFEELLVYPNPELIKFFNKCKSQGKRIIAISDMYLPRDFIEKLLNKSGFYFDRVYVSSELCKTKAKGDLFEYVKGVEDNQILHIGDNFKSDVLMAQQKGIDAILYKNGRKIPFYIDNPSKLSERVHNGLLLSKGGIPNFYKKIGYVFGGPIALAYVNFLQREYEKNNLDLLILTARDGWCIQKILEAYFPKIKTQYVYLNRIVGIRALCEWCDNPKYLKLLLSIYKEKIPDIEVTSDYVKNKREFEKFKDLILQEAASYRESLYKHLHEASEGAQRIGLVDVTTSSYSSYIFAKRILGARVKTAFFLLTYLDKSDEFIYQTFKTNEIEIGTRHIVELLESLISSPENPVLSYENGKPLYSSNEAKDKKQIYFQIFEGINAYVLDFVSRFGWIDELMFTADDWSKYINNSLAQFSEDDLKLFELIKFSAEPDGSTNKHNILRN